jgi:hypothetical protein
MVQYAGPRAPEARAATSARGAGFGARKLTRGRANRAVACCSG